LNIRKLFTLSRNALLRNPNLNTVIMKAPIALYPEAILSSSIIETAAFLAVPQYYFVGRDKRFVRASCLLFQGRFMP
jgi:hypothetical protein